MPKQFKPNSCKLVNENNTIGNLVRKKHELSAKLNQTENDLRNSLELMQCLKKEKESIEYDLRIQKEIIL